MGWLRFNDVFGTASVNPITLPSSGNSCTWPSAPPGLGKVAYPDQVKLVVEEGTANEEIVYIFAYTPGSTSASCYRGQEGTSMIAHTAVAWVHGPTANDFKSPASRMTTLGLWR